MNSTALKLIDYDALTYGSRISPVTIVALTGVPQKDRQFALEIVKLCKAIAMYLFSRDGKHYDVIMDKDSVRILTDEEAQLKFRARMRQQAQARRTSLDIAEDIDVGKLTQEAKEQLGNDRNRAGRIQACAQQKNWTVPKVKKTHERP